MSCFFHRCWAKGSIGAERYAASGCVSMGLFMGLFVGGREDSCDSRQCNLQKGLFTDIDV